jgi:type I restriction enzyme, R subunit
VLSTSTQSAYDSARALDGDTLQVLRDALNRFTRFYGFLSQALPYVPPDTEVLYQFSKVLLRRLQSDKPQGGIDLAGQIVLTHYRIAQADADAITLGDDDVQPLTAITGDGTGGGAGEIPMSLLGELVDLFNERYGAELGDVDALKVMTDVRDSVRDENPTSPTRPKPTPAMTSYANVTTC